MKEIYYYTGFIIFWAISATVAGVVLWIAITWAYQRLKRLYQYTWLHDWIDKLLWEKRYFNKKVDNPDFARPLIYFIKRHIDGKMRHRYKRKIFPQMILLILECPKIKNVVERDEEYSEIFNRAIAHPDYTNTLKLPQCKC